MKESLPRLSCGRPRYVVAMVLGTALSSLGGSAATAATDSPATARAITDISRYCTACWRNARLHPDSWPDCTQEVFCRLLERVATDDWSQALGAEGAERQELIRAIDAVKKRSQRSHKAAALPQQVADHRAPEATDDREAIRLAAEEVLTPRQRRILQLSFAGWSVHDIAEQLHLPAARVSDEKYKAIHRLRTRLAAGV